MIEGLTEQQKDTIQKARKRVIEAIGKNMDLYGVTLSVGHLYGLLFFSEKPMTLDDMGKEMEMSKTSMSTGVRTLLDLKMVHKVWEKGARKDLYEAETDWYQTFTDYFTIQWRKAVETNVSALKRSSNELLQMLEREQQNESLIALVHTDLEKIQSALHYYDWLDRLIDAMENGDIFSYIPRERTE